MSKFRIRGRLDPNDAQALAYLQQLERLVEANPLHVFRPHRKQEAFLRSRAKVRVFLGGNRAGKSTVGIVDDLINVLPKEYVPEHLLPFKRCLHEDVRGRVVTPDLVRTLKAVYEVIQRWVPAEALRGGSWGKAFDKQDRILNFKNGSFIEFMSYEQDRDKFGGSARDFVHYDEEPPGERGEEIREECRVRLVDRQGYELFTFTPLMGLTWAFDAFWEEKGPQVAEGVWDREKLTVVLASMLDNPHLSKEAIADALEGLTEEEIAARRDGKFSHFQGLVYSEFDWDRHTVPGPSPKHVQGLEVRVGIDPGIQTTAVLLGGFDKDNCLLVFDELYLHNRDAIPENAARKTREKLARWGVSAKYFLIDPSARNRAGTDADKVQAAYARAGVRALPAQNDVEAGIFEVKRRFQRTPHPLLLISRDCTTLLWERDRYRYEFKSDGGFGVSKRNDHGLDAMRYLAMSRPTAPKSMNLQKARNGSAFRPGVVPPIDEIRRKVDEWSPTGKFS